MQENAKKSPRKAIFWCKVEGVEWKGGKHAAAKMLQYFDSFFNVIM
jgi:hypothetical protein